MSRTCESLQFTVPVFMAIVAAPVEPGPELNDDDDPELDDDDPIFVYSTLPIRLLSPGGDPRQFNLGSDWILAPRTLTEVQDLALALAELSRACLDFIPHG